jgi:hypothetical protein
MKGEATNCGADHLFSPLWEKWISTWPLPVMNKNMYLSKGQFLTISDFKAYIIPIECTGWWWEHDELWSCEIPAGSMLIFILRHIKVFADYADYIRGKPRDSASISPQDQLAAHWRFAAVGYVQRL